MTVFTVKSEDLLIPVAEKILSQYPEKRIFALSGDLGVGKTAFVKSITSILGIHDKVSSPTFSLVNEYLTDSGTVYHFDLYRLENQEEVYDIGFEEYLDSGAYCFIEWPEKIAELLPAHESLFINFVMLPDQSRQISIE